MPGKRYLSVDGGGTKLISLLFDDRETLLASGTSGSINPNFERLENIREHMLESMAPCLQALGDAYLDTVWISMPGPYELYERLLRLQCKAGDFISLSEGETGLLAGLGKTSGLVVLCGTGSVLFYLNGAGESYVRGGWGGHFGDEASGYDIGRHGISAAIWGYEGRGPATLLVERLREQMGGGEFREAVMRFYTEGGDIRGKIARLCPLVTNCAEEGDLVSLRILSDAGEAAASQAEAIIRQEKLPPDLDIVTDGGAWKSHPVMFEAFSRHIAGFYPDANLHLPHFDPVMGPVVRMAMKGADVIAHASLERLKKEFARYACRWEGYPASGREKRV